MQNAMTEVRVVTSTGHEVVITQRKSFLREEVPVIDMDFTDLFFNPGRKIVVSLGPETLEKFMAALNAVATSPAPENLANGG